MDLNLLSIVPAIFLVIFIVILLWGVGKVWKSSKFIAFVLIALAVAIGIGFYAIYGKRFFG